MENEAHFAEIYRQWMQEQPETHIESIDQHVARFMAWFVKHAQPLQLKAA